MAHFKKYRDTYRRYMVYNGKMWFLYPYIPAQNEFERGLKYSLCERFYSDTDGAYRNIERCKVSSIKEAETLLKTGVIV